MAVPTVVSISANSGPAGGRNLVTITGTNFRQQTPAPALGSTVGYESPPSVRVTVNGEVVRSVAVVSATILRVEMPAYRGSVLANDAVAVAASDVVVTNIDDAGVAIPGETVTVIGGYTYVREPLLAPAATLVGEVYRRVTERVLGLFRQQVHPQTHQGNVSLDFGASGVTVVYNAELPNITLEGPAIGPDPWRGTNHKRVVWDSGSGTYKVYYPPSTRALEYKLRALVGTKAEGMYLQQAIEAVFLRNGYLTVDPDPATPAAPRDVYPFHMTEPPVLTPGPAGSNLSVISVVFQVRGVDFELPQIHAEAEQITTLRQENQQGLTSAPPATLEVNES